MATRYKLICFDKTNCDVDTELVTFGHPLLNAVIALTLKNFGDTLKRGTIFIDDTADNKKFRLLCCIEIEIRDGRQNIVSKRLHFVEVSEDGQTELLKCSQYPDFRAPTELEREKILSDAQNISRLALKLEDVAKNFSVKNLALPYRREVERSRKIYLDKIERAVRERLTNEINFWDERAAELRAKDKLNSEQATRRADEFEIRLNQRLNEICIRRKLDELASRMVK